MLTIGSIFSGIGGLELGLERAGLGPVLWQAEIDASARRVLARHWPDARRYRDVKEIDGKAPPVDVMCGGFPCQDVSLAGKGAGLDGPRSGLWFEFARAIRALRPRYVVVENVAALRRRGLDRVLGDLAQAGYDAEWTTLRASDVGAPHRRERVFILAWLAVGAERVSDTDSGAVRELAERGGVGPRPADERDAEPVDVGADDVANPDRDGLPLLGRGGLHDGERAALGHDADGCGPVGVADADRSRCVGSGRLRAEAGREAPRWGQQAVAGEGGAGVADAASDGRREGRAELARREREPAHVVGGRAHEWPPGPADADGWRSYLERWPGTQPALRRGVDGVPVGLDGGGSATAAELLRNWRLHALGNAVVPQCAEVIGRMVVAMEQTRRAA